MGEKKVQIVGILINSRILLFNLLSYTGGKIVLKLSEDFSEELNGIEFNGIFGVIKAVMCCKILAVKYL